MAIPQNILNVVRPKNTFVICYGKNKDHYAVRQRLGCKYDNGRRIPVNGPIIGHIVDEKYVPKEVKKISISMSNIDLKDWANVTLCNQLFEDVKQELLDIYNRDDALKIYCIAILRVCNPGIKDNELKAAYEESFLSEYYPNVALSKNTVCTFQNNLGKSYSKIVEFMVNRTSKVDASHHLLIDGTLKTNDSIVNSFSDFSRKGRVKGSQDISILYAFDLENMEPVCSKCFPGNMLDLTAYESFIEDNKIKKGLIVTDKGFPASKAKRQFKSNPDLHYLNPIKRNSKVIKEYSMYNYTNVLNNFDGITGRKEKCKDGTFLYSFRDSFRAYQEEKGYIKNSKKDGTYSDDKLKEKQQVFGTIVLESDLDMSLEDAYKAYSMRWEIEVLMRYYKTACEFNETRVHDDYSVIGSEFIDFLSSTLTFKLINFFDKKEVSKDYGYKKTMKMLERAKKVRLNDEWKIIKITPSLEELLKKIGLIIIEETEPKKRGRPKKSDV